GFDRNVELALRKGAAQIVVVAGKIVPPKELVTRRANSPQIVTPDGERDDDEDDCVSSSQMLWQRHLPNSNRALNWDRPPGLSGPAQHRRASLCVLCASAVN